MRNAEMRNACQDRTASPWHRRYRGSAGATARSGPRPVSVRNTRAQATQYPTGRPPWPCAPRGTGSVARSDRGGRRKSSDWSARWRTSGQGHACAILSDMVRFVVATLALTCATLPALADVIGPGGKVIDCFCTEDTRHIDSLVDALMLPADDSGRVGQEKKSVVGLASATNAETKQIAITVDSVSSGGRSQELCSFRHLKIFCSAVDHVMQSTQRSYRQTSGFICPRRIPRKITFIIWTSKNIPACHDR